MLKKRNLKTASMPTMFLFVTTFLIQNLIDYFSLPASYEPTVLWFILNMAGWIVTCIILSVFAYMTCWALVFRRNKSERHMWINYIVWWLIMNLGTVADFLNK